MKELLKRISIGLADTQLGRAALLRRSTYFVPVFMMHRFRTGDGSVAGHDPERVDEALKFLLDRRFRIMAVDDVVRGLSTGTLPDRVVCFTIDDGYWDQAAVGAEIFLNNDCPVTIFLATEMLESGYWPVEAKVSYLVKRMENQVSMSAGDALYSAIPLRNPDSAKARRSLVYALKELPIEKAEIVLNELAERAAVPLPGHAPPEYRAVSWADARLLEARGVSFGGHTCRHVTLSRESDSVSRSEIERCHSALRENLQVPSRIFCYPTGRRGDYGEREIGYLRELGYAGALAAEPGYARFDDQPDSEFHLLRFGFTERIEEFKDVVLQLDRVRDSFRSLRR